ncbi:hypothetical protein BO94DRAFT_535770 [Aspergillus sclerotioniger CBS 115572]|uniref:Metalloendopeptidase n=1 Tax=Aspergillus sclerotioniger CBS 115572 TaxID=1450535 RepID=A0A317WJX5_9EURO|nr:hypothetical protein BO94DRAFT_535770 [Aspergillus sclerotioniger CBS 115572]PWY86629.1 hypothetical protein BO94DRAFT_535770 [Aspergillus sclerotioniger CBS 115572]
MASLWQWMMGFLLFFFFLLLLATFPVVDAGHPDWEHARFPSTEFLSLKPGLGSHFWPESTIPLCYESDDTRNIFHDILWAAMRLWYAAGLPERFRLLEINGQSCTDKPWESLYVKQTRDLFSSDIGMPMVNMEGTPFYPPVNKPTLHVFINRANMQWTIKQVAHELGHSFGLLHEHQDPSFWGLHSTERVFKFNCIYLVDFNEVTKDLSVEEIWGIHGVCKDQRQANSVGFRAADWLPEQGEIYSSHWWWADASMVDWDSIMLYQSFSDTIDYDNKPVLSRYSDAWTWGPNWSPSVGDVAALKTIYHSFWVNPSLPFWNDIRSPYYEVFRQFSSC